MAKSKKHTDELGKLNINKLLLKLSIPATIGMLVMVIYNVVDTIFVAKYVGSMAIGGLAIVMPITMLISAMGMAFGVGGSSIISRHLGAGEQDSADRVFGNLLMLSLTFTVTFTVLGYIFTDEILLLFGASGEIIPYAKEYYLIVLAGSPLLGLSMAGNSIIRSEGNARMSMTVMLVSALINVLLDAVFIVWFDYGIAGAAWATIIAQIITFVYIFYYFLASGKSSVNFKVQYLRLESKIIMNLTSIGSSSFARQGASSVIAVLINHSLMIYGSEIDVAIYGILSKVMFMSFFPIIGLTQAFLPILGYNYGANNFGRVKTLIKSAAIISIIVGGVAFALISQFPIYVMEIFTNDKDIIIPGARFLKIIIFTMPLVGLQVLGASFFQGIGKATKALTLTLTRQAIFIIPLVLLLPSYYGIDGIWYAFPVADILSTIITLIIIVPEIKKISKKVSSSEID
ncbi:MAG: MATE family efflux transporter [Ichthyobacteriaceae bacterium]|nr:MATE family efflux transporter [Ichthyobacteriaceae bacterium]